MLMSSSMNEILVSLSCKGGVRDLPGDTEGDAKGIRRLDLRMDCGVNSANPELTDIANVLAFCDKQKTISSLGFVKGIYTLGQTRSFRSQ